MQLLTFVKNLTLPWQLGKKHTIIVQISLLTSNLFGLFILNITQNELEIILFLETMYSTGDIYVLV